MIYPKFIQKGDTIGVTAPSSGTECEMDLIKLKLAKQMIERRGYSLMETENCRQNICGRSSSGKKRGEQLNQLFKAPNIQAIFCLCGGEFLVEMLPYVDFDMIRQNPKWIQGYSDPTGLLFSITTQCDIATIYGDNLRSFSMDPWHSSLQNQMEILEGKHIIQHSFDQYENERKEYITGKEPFALTKDVQWINLKGEDIIHLSGRMIGGCLDILLSLIGTRFDGTKKFLETYKNDGIVWYFDNCELSSEEIIRSMWQFKELGYFQYTKGIIFGRTGLEKSYYDISFLEAIQQSLGDLKLPIILEADIGHKPPRMSILNGAIAHIDSQEGKGQIQFELK